MKRLTVSCILFLCAATVCLGETNRNESHTIATYYPSPTGVYANLRLNPANSTPAGINQTGVMFFNNTINTIQFYNRTGNLTNLTGGSVSAGGNWAYNESTQAINNTNYTKNFTCVINGKDANGDVLKVRGDMRITDRGGTDSAYLYIFRRSANTNSSCLRLFTEDDYLDTYNLWMKGNPGIFSIGNRTHNFTWVNRTTGRVTLGNYEDSDIEAQLNILGNLSGGSPKQTIVKLEGDGEIALTMEAASNTLDLCPTIIPARARGRYAAMTSVRNNDSIFLLDGKGWNGTGYNSAGGYRMSADADFTAALIPSKFSFSTTPVSSTIPVERMVFKATNGNIGIGTSNPQWPLQVNVTSPFYGYMDTSNMGKWGHTSDRRFKKNISGIKDALAKVLRVKGIRYDSISRKSSPGEKGRNFGFIGQDLEKVMPELVETGPGGYRAVSYGGITPVLVEAIKENQKYIDSLRKEIEELKSQE